MVVILIRVKPSNRINRLLVDKEEKFTFQVKSPPIKGKANREIIKWFSKKLHISKKSVCIIKGLKSKEKTLEIYGVDMKQILELSDTLSNKP